MSEGITITSRGRVDVNCLTRLGSAAVQLPVLRPRVDIVLRAGAPGPRGDLLGWANYVDTGGPQSIAANSRTAMTNNGATAATAQLPPDISAFLSGNRIRANEGDSLVLRIKMTVTPLSGAASKIRTELDVGLGVIDEFTEQLSGGLGVAHRISKTIAAYVGSGFAANGCGLFVTCDGPVTLSSKALLVERGHKAR